MNKKKKTMKLFAGMLSASLVAVAVVTLFATTKSVDGATSSEDIIGYVPFTNSSSTAESSSSTAESTSSTAESSSGFDGDKLLWAKAGDIDGSNEPNQKDAVNEKDVVYLLNHIHFPDVYPVEDGINCDLNKDGKVDDNDVAYLKLYLESPNSFPIQETTDYGGDD